MCDLARSRDFVLDEVGSDADAFRFVLAPGLGNRAKDRRRITANHSKQMM